MLITMNIDEERIKQKKQKPSGAAQEDPILSKAEKFDWI